MKQLDEDVFAKVSVKVEKARTKIASTINQEMIILYWNIGNVVRASIIKSDRAQYGKQTVQALSVRLTSTYGKGFSPQNLWYMVQLFDTYPILHSLRGELGKLSWTHIRTLLPIKDDLKRNFYATLCQRENWNTRTLKERVNCLLYERTALSKLPEKTITNQLMELKEEDKIKVSEYLTKLPTKELFAEKLDKAVRTAQSDLEDKR